MIFLSVLAIEHSCYYVFNHFGSRHWQYGGPEGTIVTEVTTVYDGSSVRHSDPSTNDHFLDQ